MRRIRFSISKLASKSGQPPVNYRTSCTVLFPFRASQLFDSRDAITRVSYVSAHCFNRRAGLLSTLVEKKYALCIKTAHGNELNIVTLSYAHASKLGILCSKKRVKLEGKLSEPFLSFSTLARFAHAAPSTLAFCHHILIDVRTGKARRVKLERTDHSRLRPPLSTGRTRSITHRCAREHAPATPERGFRYWAKKKSSFPRQTRAAAD